VEIVCVDVTRPPWYLPKPHGMTDDQAIRQATTTWRERLLGNMRRMYQSRLYSLAECRLIIGPRTRDMAYAQRYRDLLEDIAGDVMEEIEAKKGVSEWQSE